MPVPTSFAESMEKRRAKRTAQPTPFFVTTAVILFALLMVKVTFGKAPLPPVRRPFVPPPAPPSEPALATPLQNAVDGLDAVIPADRPMERRQIAKADRRDHELSPLAVDSLIRADRRSIKRLEEAQKFLEQKNYRDAFVLLQLILESPDDVFIARTTPRGEVVQSLRETAAQAVLKLPRPARDAYELEFGGRARQLLQHAEQTGDFPTLCQAARSYPGTLAGAEALFRCGRIHQDRGAPLAAVLEFSKLQLAEDLAKRFEPMLSLRMARCWQLAGEPERAKVAFEHWEKKRSNPPLLLGGREHPLPAKNETFEIWLNRTFGEPRDVRIAPPGSWTAVAGGSRRDSRAHQAFALNPAALKSWQLRTLVNPLLFPDDVAESPVDRRLKETYLAMRDDARKTGIPTSSAMVPVTVDGLVIFRTLGHLRAVDLETGERRWETLPDETLEQCLDEGTQHPFFGSRHALPTLLRQRLWEDRCYGSLSTDGRNVYSIEDSGFAISVSEPRAGVIVPPADTNRLCAYDARDGRLIWEVGGPTGDFALELAGCFFLGPPLAYDGTLLVLAERRNAIELLVLDPVERGKLVWSIKLSQSDTGIERNRPQRLRGLSPSASDGMIICPTGNGLLVAVDVSGRLLRWAASCANISNPARKGPGRFPLANHQVPAGLTGHTLPIISRGRVVASSPDGRRLHCFRLSDGTPLWNSRETGTIQILAVSSEAIFVREGNGINARRLNDGTDFWTRSVDVPGLTGHGVLLDEALLLPLTSGEVINIDIKAGRETARWKVPGDRPLGNLIWSGHRLISQSETVIELLPRQASNP